MLCCAYGTYIYVYVCIYVCIYTAQRLNKKLKFRNCEKFIHWEPVWHQRFLNIISNILLAEFMELFPKVSFLIISSHRLLLYMGSCSSYELVVPYFSYWKTLLRPTAKQYEYEWEILKHSVLNRSSPFNPPLKV